MSTKISTVINGVHSGTIVLPGDVITCQMAGQFADAAWMTDGTTEQDVENAVSSGKMVVCTLFNQSISTEPITLIAQSILSPYPLFTGVCKVGQNLAHVTASYDEVNSTSESEVWAIQCNVQSSGVPYGVCNAEVYSINMSVNAGNFSLRDGASALIRFTNGIMWQGGSQPVFKLNINNTGAKTISIWGTLSLSYLSTAFVGPGQTVLVVYHSNEDSYFIISTDMISARLQELALNKQNLLPSYTNNSGKVLAVNNSEDGLEWVPQSGGGITIDTALSETSTNPVQNKAINVLTRKLWQRVDIVSRLGNEYPTTRNYITSGHWTSSTTYKHWAVPVDGMRAVTVTANSSQYAIISFLKTYNSTSGTPDFATGYNGNSIIDAGKTRIFNVPEDANWLIVMTGSSSVRKPSHVYLTGVAVNNPQLTYIQLASGAMSCDISLTDTKQSFVIDNSANGSSVPVNVTNQFNSIYSNEKISIDANFVVQFDFESVESEQKVYLFVKQTVLYDQTPS